MRARLALHASGVAVELREIALRNKPNHMREASPKGSVPVLILPDGRVIDESWEIMQWALRQHDPEVWLGEQDSYLIAATPLINRNDTSFKYALDRYKYADRYPEFSRIYYRNLGAVFLLTLEEQLQTTRYLFGDTPSIADAAVLPFIRQFAEVDKDWFAQSPYPALRIWLTEIVNSPRFAAVMQKQPIWQAI
jgi:glutathione S-transferase